MISHSKKFIFLKTRKTAGTSIEMFLEPFCAAPGHIVTEKTECIISEHGVIGARKIDRSTAAKGSLRYINHMPAKKIRALIGSDIWASYTKVTSIRNPFGRAVSHFHFRNRKRPLEIASDDKIRLLFRKFLLEGDVPNDKDIVHINRKFIPDIVIKYENFEKDMAEFSLKFGLDFQLKKFPTAKALSHMRNLEVPDYFDAETTNFIRKQWAWAFDRFGYSAQPADYQAGL